MAAPLLQAQIDIDAPVAKVWALVSDLGRMPQWSPRHRLELPAGTGTLLVESRHAESASLSRIKAAAEH